MRRWVRIALWVVAVVVAVSVIIGGGAALIVWRNTTVTPMQAQDAGKEFERIRAQFLPRQPLVEIVDPGPIMLDVRVNRPPATAPRQPLKFFHVLAWDGRDGKLVRSRAPFWWMNFSAENVLANLGVRLGNLTLTVADVERYGAGVVVDFTPPGGGRVLVWVQ